MSKPRLLDLFCGAGGAGEGYRRAGFDVTGVDIKPMPNNPHTFIQADALEYLEAHGHEYDAIHASPPCQRYSTIAIQQQARGVVTKEYPDLVAPTRELLQASGKPYVMENVPNAPLHTTILLCGSMFGLDVRRHRLFESNVMLFQPHCQHDRQTPRFRSLNKRRNGKLACVVGVHGHVNYAGEWELRKKAMGIDWMSSDELSQAIPPAYTEYIGRQLITIVQANRAEVA